MSVKLKILVCALILGRLQGALTGAGFSSLSKFRSIPHPRGSAIIRHAQQSGEDDAFDEQDSSPPEEDSGEEPEDQLDKPSFMGGSLGKLKPTPIIQDEEEGGVPEEEGEEEESPFAADEEAMIDHADDAPEFPEPDENYPGDVFLGHQETWDDGFEENEIRNTIEFVEFKIRHVHELMKECIKNQFANDLMATVRDVKEYCVGLTFQILFQNYNEGLRKLKEIITELLKLKFEVLSEDFEDEAEFFMDLLEQFIEKDLSLPQSLRATKRSAKYFVSSVHYDKLMALAAPEIAAFDEVHKRIKNARNEIADMLQEEAKEQETYVENLEQQADVIEQQQEEEEPPATEENEDEEPDEEEEPEEEEVEGRDPESEPEDDEDNEADLEDEGEEGAGAKKGEKDDEEEAGVRKSEGAEGEGDKADADAGEEKKGEAGGDGEGRRLKHNRQIKLARGMTKQTLDGKKFTRTLMKTVVNTRLQTSSAKTQVKHPVKTSSQFNKHN